LSTTRLKHPLLLLLTLAGLYYLVFGRYGYHPTDQGFVSALAWRVWLGQTPYLDFIYVRPPLSAYLHAWEMALPATWHLRAGRLVFYLQMALATWWMLRSLEHSLQLRQRGVSLGWLAALALVGALHNYSPMPWHTVDGIFWGALGFYLLVVPQRRGLWTLGLWVLVAAALCKQSFYPLPLLGAALLLSYHPWRRGLGAVALGLGLPLLGLVALMLQRSDWLAAALAQTVGATRLQDLALIGGWQYLKALPGLALGVALVEFSQGKGWRRYLVYLWPAALLGGAGLHLTYALWQGRYAGPQLAYGQLLWLAALASVYAGVRASQKGGATQGKAYLPLLALLGLAWCASLSWGYATPVLAFAPLAVAGRIGAANWGLGQGPRWLWPATALALALIWGLCSLYPYREAPRYQAYQAGDKLFPALTGLQLGPQNYARLAELKRFASRYGTRFTVLPAYPAAHLLTQQDPPFASDWAQNAEVNAALLLPTLQTILDTKVAYVFLQIDKLDRLEDRDRYGLLLGAYVRDEWELVEEGRFLQVYRNPRVSQFQRPGLAVREGS
jgi:hypothetical protein